MMKARLLGVFAVLALLFAPMSAAQAHDGLVNANPADGSTVETVPTKVTLSFSGVPMGQGDEVVVTGPQGPITDGKPTIVDRTLTQQLKPGAPAGEYRIDWRITSADGHPVSGKLSFTAKKASAGAPSSSAAAPAATSSSTAAAAPSQAATPTSESGGMSGATIAVLGVGALLVIGAVVFGLRRAGAHANS